MAFEETPTLEGRLLAAIDWKRPHEALGLLRDHGKEIDIQAKDNLALGRACQKGMTEVVVALLDHGANVHAGNDYALRHAAGDGDLETVKLLLDRGADIHANSDIALRNAAGNGWSQTVTLLLDRGADIHAKEDEALRGATAQNRVTTTRLLLERGADVHCLEDLPLKIAAHNGHREIVKLLLAHGANPHATEDLALREASMRVEVLQAEDPDSEAVERTQEVVNILLKHYSLPALQKALRLQQIEPPPPKDRIVAELKVRGQKETQALKKTGPELEP